ncbi:MAG TPA: hypothetical protein VGT44_16620 [Ktedonobacteraceae bacterium]|nr:hypothetical protein [Ktedonobacteraceae bacterium]
MPGRKEQEKYPWERGVSAGSDSLNGTGRQRPVPQRPPGLARVDTPPAVPRVNRPQRQTKPPKSFRRRLLIFVGALAVLCVLIFAIVYGITNFVIGASSSAGAASTAGDFLSNLQIQNYSQAYQDLDATLTLNMKQLDFQQMATADDKCYGLVTDYTEVSGSATTSTNGNTQSFTYTITRSKLSKTYTLTLTLGKDSNGSWDITNFGPDLGPAPPPATCK